MALLSGNKVSAGKQGFSVGLALILSVQREKSEQKDQYGKWIVDDGEWLVVTSLWRDVGADGFGVARGGFPRLNFL